MTNETLARLVAGDTETATNGVVTARSLEEQIKRCFVPFSAYVERLGKALREIGWWGVVDDCRCVLVLKRADVLPYPLAIYPDNVREMG